MYRALSHILNGCSTCQQSEDITPYYHRREELLFHRKIVVLSVRIFLQDLHSGHQALSIDKTADTFVGRAALDRQGDTSHYEVALDSGHFLPSVSGLSGAAVTSGPDKNVSHFVAFTLGCHGIFFFVQNFSNWTLNFHNHL